METYNATHRARLGLVALTGLLLFALVPKIGWTPALLACVTGAQLLALDRFGRRARRAEYALAASYVLVGLWIAVGVAITGGVTSPILSLCVLPLLLLANRFRRRVTLWGLGFSLLTMAVAAAAPDPAAVVRDPSWVIFTAVLMCAVIVLTFPHYDVEKGLRSSTHIDPLTGLLNRSSLEERFGEASAACAAAGRPLSLVLFDLDSFKAINDVHGHDMGDEVLRQAAAVIVSHSRSADQVYRLGGEEIGLLLTGIDLDEAAEVADRQRRALEEARPGGIVVTVSGGVASTRGAGARWLDLYRAADQALLQAKSEGRNRIRSAGADVPARSVAG